MAPGVFSILLLGSIFGAQAETSTGSWEIIYDADTKVPLQGARFTTGTRQLSWLGPDEPTGKTKKNVGPEHLEFREEKSTTFKDGIATWVAVASLHRLEYEHDKKLVRAFVKQQGGKDSVLVGSTQFVGVNKFSLEGTAAKTGLGATGPLQLQDGLIKLPFRALVQIGAKPVADAASVGRPALVIAQDKEKTEHQVYGLTPLYRVGAAQKRAPVLMFQKVGQIDVAKLVTLRRLPGPDKKQPVSADFEVTQLGGDKQKLTLLDQTQLTDNQPAVLIGLVGRVPAGFKLFPPHTIAEVRFETKAE